MVNGKWKSEKHNQRLSINSGAHTYFRVLQEADTTMLSPLPTFCSLVSISGSRDKFLAVQSDYGNFYRPMLFNIDFKIIINELFTC